MADVEGISSGRHRRLVDVERAVGGSSLGTSGAAGLAERGRGPALDALVARAAVKTAPPPEPSAAVLSARPDDLSGVVTLAMAGNRQSVERLLTSIRPLVVRYCRARIGRQERSFAS